MHIDKLARDAHAHRRPCLPFKNARSAFKAFLQVRCPAPSDKILLPCYIGWSPREGSGVFDPVAELGLEHRFYRMDERLTIDLEHLRRCFKTDRIKLLVIIHYFGYVDPGYREAVALAREHGALVLEDEAHALFTDLVGGVAGRLGDAAIFSLHKMLPVESGGMLLLNGDRGHENDGIRQDHGCTVLPWEFDLPAIARVRVANAHQLADLLAPHRELVEPLREELLPGVIPQTLPVIIRKGSRDRIYQTMNAAGFGVVTLYHTLIDRIGPQEYPEAHRLSRRILNLPLHQDADREMLVRMTERLMECIRESATEEG